MPDQLVGEQNPFVLRNHLHQILLDLFRIVVAGEIQTFRQALHVRIDNDARGDAVSGAENHVGRLTSHAWKREQLLHRARYFPPERLDDRFACADDGFRLVAEESRRPDFLLEVFRGGVGESFRSRILDVERLRHLDYAPVRALRREDR